MNANRPPERRDDRAGAVAQYIEIKIEVGNGISSLRLLVKFRKLMVDSENNPKSISHLGGFKNIDKNSIGQGRKDNTNKDQFKADGRIRPFCFYKSETTENKIKNREKKSK